MEPILNFQKGNTSIPVSLDIKETHLLFSPTIIIIVALIPVVLGFLLYAKNDISPLQNEDGNRIPTGPRGIPVLGMLYNIFSFRKKLIHCLRLLSIFDEISGTDTRPLG